MTIRRHAELLAALQTDPEQGERRALTDLRHVGQLLNAAAVEENLGLTALTRWLTDRIRDPRGGGR